MLKFQLVFRSGTKAVSVVLVIRKQCVWIATHKTGKQCECSYTLTFPAVCLLRAVPPNPFLNTEFHSVATRSANAFLSIPGAPFRSIGVRESLPPFCYVPWKPGWQNTTPVFSFRDGCDGRNGAGSTPQNTVATVASVALYSITSNASASTTM